MQINDEKMQIIAQRFKAMSEPIRLKILHLLKNCERSVGEIAETLDMKPGTASANLNALSKAGLVASRRDGTKIYYRISNIMVIKICDIACDCINKEIDAMIKMQGDITKSNKTYTT